MDPITVMLIAIALAMDCFAVSIAAGIRSGDAGSLRLLLMPFSFGVFQTCMSLGGWYAGIALALFISAFDHWAAFFLLVLVGGKMLLERREDEERPLTRDLTVLAILALSLVTSIDALGAGFSLAMLDDGILFSSVVIGLVSFGFSLAGIALGTRLFERIGRRAEVVGGLILIGIGLRILLEHLSV